VCLNIESLFARLMPRVREAWQSPRRLGFFQTAHFDLITIEEHDHFLPSRTHLLNTDKMVRYAPQHITPAKSARSRGSYLRVSFKNTRETAQAINGWKVQRAIKYLENVQELKECVPMRRYAGSTGRSAQGM
jgi:hypothetical protein